MGPSQRSRFSVGEDLDTVFRSAWFSAVPRDFDSEYEMRPDQLLA